MNMVFIDDDLEILHVYDSYVSDLPKELNFHGQYLQDSRKLKDPQTMMRLVLAADAIFCDLAMPEFDGREMLDIVMDVRQHLRKTIPFFIVTGASPNYCAFDDTGWGKLVKADDVLTKPLLFDDFSEILAKHGLIKPKPINSTRLFSAS
ncbi:hypothetical protein [Pseudobacteriovorax antillogorgiicola]|uniref:Response regulatory domain-containing protein n=1 Tax=Pseudobacteriovorax antillogorgiicola TaxID=1513793 RepID=A0A1Y6CJD2_9BACT|nr:hypothetical protein [Pseudobacteriovorax antillogorgiicola]TCS46410.1 hypothetical protein EDD56_12474 [Pseudobacteriovorax antillogorgiicola]SMF68894.1 hypothetical protein SAMN06296036_12474 [Pseudobacteriovorax antillogorgiicola]